MPAINTRGALSARGFGFGATAAAAGYKWMTQNTSGGNTLNYSNTTLVPQTGSLSTGSVAWQGTDSRTYAGLVTFGNLIVVPIAFSTDKGVNWTFISSYNYTTGNDYTPAGPSSNVAMHPTTGSFISIFTVPIKSGYAGYISYRNSSGAGNTFTSSYTPSIYAWKQAFCWPSKSSFYVLQSSTSQFRWLSTSGTDYGDFTNPAGATIGNQKLCTSVDGTTLYFSAGANIYSTTSADWSGFTNLGADAYSSQGFQSQPIKGIGGYWWKTYASGGSLVLVRSSTTDGPYGWSYYTIISGGTFITVYGKQQLYYDSTDGKMYAITNGNGYVGKYTQNFFAAWRSTDATTWNYLTSGWMSIARNYQS